MAANVKVVTLDKLKSMLSPEECERLERVHAETKVSVDALAIPVVTLCLSEHKRFLDRKRRAPWLR